VDKKQDGSSSQMIIIVGISSFFTGLVLALRGNTDNRGIRIMSD
jgi:hypothetical protein